MTSDIPEGLGAGVGKDACAGIDLVVYGFLLFFSCLVPMIFGFDLSNTGGGGGSQFHILRCISRHPSSFA
uniref:Putative ovule protein n=1 Tax=Solanum chacoense TaxID=4108 RepID=A0A0V0GRC1_SOLCH